jgi:ABC-type Fe3+/spermidine/putrescine transport system ATPase subunit
MSVSLSGITVTYGGTTAVDAVSLEVTRSERLAIMGPSGAGKSTLLRALAGLIPVSGGSIEVDGSDISVLPTHRRPVGLMFQDYALVPHMTVAENVAFGLRMAGVDAPSRSGRVAELLGMVDLSGYGDRSPSSLSGGERQRVALARTLAPEPSVVLLDEPLGSVDQVLKDDLIVQMRDILSSLGMTSIYVTHDRYEAETFASRIAIMRAGHIVRVGTPADIWDEPHTEFVARFMGHRNLVEGRSVGRQEPRVLILPSAISIDPAGAVQGVVRSSSFRDGAHRSEVQVDGGVVEVESDEPLAVGLTIDLAIDPDGLRAVAVDEV